MTTEDQNTSALNESGMETEEKASKEPRPPPRRLAGLRGEVTKSRRFGVCVSFQHEGKAQVAGLLPGRAYVNATSHLLDECKSDQELALIFPKGLEVNFDCIECEKYGRYQHNNDKSKDAAAAKDVEKDGPGKFDTFGWRITQLWFSQKPEAEDCPADLTAEAESFQKRRQWVSQNVLSTEATPAAPPSAEADTWFVRTAPIWPLPHPDKASVKNGSGVVAKLHRPGGGIVKVGGVDVFFHRARVFLDTEHLSATADLTEMIPVGTQVQVDYSTLEELKAGTRSLERDCPEGITHVALLVFTESRPALSDIIFNQKALNYKENVKGPNARHPYYMARMVSFDAAGASGVEGGVAELVSAHAHAQLRPQLKRVIASAKSAGDVKKVRFNRRNLFHLGASLENADLSYFFSPALFGMDLFYCYLRPLTETERNTLPIAHAGVTHEVSLGWKSTMSYQHSTGAGLHASTANNADSTLLYTGVYSFNSIKLFAREGLDVPTYEGILDGSVPPRKDFLNGVENINEKEKVALARVEDLFPPFIKHTQVHTGLLHVESGEHAGLSAFFYRKEMSVFGFGLENADLQLFLNQNDPVFVRLANAEKGTKVKATEAWIGWPKDAANPQTMENMSAEKRYKFLLWLESHNMTVATFLKALKGEGPERQFIPFRREENKGTVVQLKRSEAKRGNKGLGSVGGIIKVESGPLTGKLVQFVRKFTWVLGYNMKDADLTHIFIEGQKVSLEAIKISEEQKNGGKKEEYQGTVISHRATMVWTSKFIPRSDIHKTVAESAHVNSWLKKRGLTFDSFKTLVKGDLPMVAKALATQNKSNMMKGDSPEAKGKDAANKDDKVAAAKTADTAKMPVFKHGPEAVRICDIALSVQGPNDPKVNKLIKNDDQAQMAFHLQKTLGLALDRYRERNGQQAPVAVAVTPKPQAKKAVAAPAQNGQQGVKRKQPQQPRPQQARPQQQQRPQQPQQQPQQQQQGNPWANNPWGGYNMQQGQQQQQVRQPMQQQPMQQQQQPMQQQQQPMNMGWGQQGQQQMQANGILGATPRYGNNMQQQGQQQQNNGGYYQQNNMGMQQQRKPMMNNGAQQQQPQNNYNQNNGAGNRAVKRGAPGKARPFQQAKRPRNNGGYNKY